LIVFKYELHLSSFELISNIVKVAEICQPWCGNDTGEASASSTLFSARQHVCYSALYAIVRGSVKNGWR